MNPETKQSTPAPSADRMWRQQEAHLARNVADVQQTLELLRTRTHDAEESLALQERLLLEWQALGRRAGLDVAP